MRVQKKFRFRFNKVLSFNTINTDKSIIPNVDSNELNKKSTPILTAYRIIEESKKTDNKICKR